MSDPATAPSAPEATAPAAPTTVASSELPTARTAASMLRGSSLSQVDEALANARAAAPTHTPEAPAAKPAAPVEAAKPATPPAEAPKAPAANPYAGKRAVAPAPKASAEVVALQAQLAAQQATIATFVDAEMAQLPANVQAEIRAVAGEDRNLAMRMIAAKKTAGTMQPAGIPSTTTAPSPASQPAGAKAVPTDDADTALMRKYDELRAKNLHGMAADFMARNQQQIQRARARATARN